MSHAQNRTAPKTITPRKPYRPPRLMSYGHVKDIVQGGGRIFSDAAGKPPGGMSRRFCWVAEAVDGVDDPRTLLLRAWLSHAYDERRPGWPIIAGYKRFGRAAASLIDRGYLPRGLFRPVLDVLMEKALDDSAPAIVVAGH